MKNALPFFILAIGCSIFFGAGCSSKLSETPPLFPMSRLSAPSSSSTTTTNVYAQWAIPFPINTQPLVNTYERKDCIGLTNGETYGGDLLSSLITDQKLRMLVPTDVYTPEYLKHLEKRIADYQLQQTPASEVYAFYACHLTDGVDLVAGYLWPHNTPRYISGGKFDGNIEPAFTASSTLIVITPNTVHTVSNLQLMDNTATGGEASPCRANLVDATHIEWSCFQGLHHTPTDDIDGSSMQYWLLDIDTGKVEKTWKTIEK